jgi:monoamine oxidase
VDLGAAWIKDTNQSEMYSLAKQFGFDSIQQRTTGRKVILKSDGSISSPDDTKTKQVLFLSKNMYPIRKLTPPWRQSIEVASVLKEFIVALSVLIERSNLDDPSQGRDAQLLDSSTLEDYAK